MFMRLLARNIIFFNIANLNSSLHDYISDLDENEVSENCVPEKNRKCRKCRVQLPKMCG